MINGFPGRKLSNSRSLQQGDSLSPLLLLLMMEGLHHLFKFATSNDILTPLATMGFAHRLSFFVAGVMMFLRPEQNDTDVCAAILHGCLRAADQSCQMQRSYYKML